jgi:hypothetical protein
MNYSAPKPEPTDRESVVRPRTVADVEPLAPPVYVGPDHAVEASEAFSGASFPTPMTYRLGVVEQEMCARVDDPREISPPPSMGDRSQHVHLCLPLGVPCRPCSGSECGWNSEDQRKRYQCDSSADHQPLYRLCL